MIKLFFSLMLSTSLFACQSTPTNSASKVALAKVVTVDKIDTTGLENAYMTGGCFWKMDAIYQMVKGVKFVEVGYAGGTTKNPTYEQVGTRKTGHSETVHILFDPKIISYSDILKIFFNVHDASILNQEGNDVGNDYRSAVFAINDSQKSVAEKMIGEINAGKQKAYSDHVVTVVEPFKNFYRAEEYHQNYYNLHPDEGYTYGVVRLKVEHFKSMFVDKIKM